MKVHWYWVEELSIDQLSVGKQLVDTLFHASRLCEHYSTIQGGFPIIRRGGMNGRSNRHVLSSAATFTKRVESWAAFVVLSSTLSNIFEIYDWLVLDRVIEASVHQRPLTWNGSGPRSSGSLS